MTEKIPGATPEQLKASAEAAGAFVAEQLRSPSRTEEFFARLDLIEPGKYPGTFTPETRKWVEEHPL